MHLLCPLYLNNIPNISYLLLFSNNETLPTPAEAPVAQKAHSARILLLLSSVRQSSCISVALIGSFRLCGAPSPNCGQFLGMRPPLPWAPRVEHQCDFCLPITDFIDDCFGGWFILIRLRKGSYAF